ncbi:MAG: hypothetical protein JSU87_06085 [Gemmatimonadota bacterium]|nr:MAG: hypothetical protein JSU87_06085 [Gemmatimonadota bacterium]
MTRTLIALVTVGLLVIACTGDNLTAPAADDLSVVAQTDALPNKVVYRVTVGGPDACGPDGPGCDANFSLIALEKADGSVEGQWHDQFYGGVGVHVAVDCLEIVGNEAWVSGVVTGKTFNGAAVVTRVADNGKSANDPVDQISYTSSAARWGDCKATPALTLYDVSAGQVKID